MQLHRLRICLIAHALRRNDGQGRVNYEVAKRAMDAGHKVTIVSMSCAQELVNHTNGTWVPVQSESLPTQLLRNIHFANKSAKWLKANRSSFDIVQGNGAVTWEPVDLVAVHFVHSAWLRNPFFPFHWMPPKPSSLYQRLYTILNGEWEKRTFATSKLIVAVSRRTAQEVQDLHVAKAPARVVYNGVDLDEFHPGPSCRIELGLPESVPLLTFVGDIRNPRKNLDTVLAALALLPLVHLAVAGDTVRSPYPAMAEAMGLGHRVHFLGKTKRVADLMRSADLMVFPSLYEAHPLVVVEAMACGLPAIISADIGRHEAFAPACILIEDPLDASVMATEVRRLLEDPAERHKVATLASETARDMSWSACAERYLELYQELAGAVPASV